MFLCQEPNALIDGDIELIHIPPVPPQNILASVVDGVHGSILYLSDSSSSLFLHVNEAIIVLFTTTMLRMEFYVFPCEFK